MKKYKEYFYKMKGSTKSPPGVELTEVLWSWLGSGHIISALIGVACYQLFGKIIWVASALAVSLAISAMLMTKTLHPPAGATSLIAVISGDNIHRLGYLYALIPAGLGAFILLIIALLVNNLSKNRRYPEYWL